jgi:hypothetical protein
VKGGLCPIEDRAITVPNTLAEKFTGGCSSKKIRFILSEFQTAITGVVMAVDSRSYLIAIKFSIKLVEMYHNFQ